MGFWSRLLGINQKDARLSTGSGHRLERVSTSTTRVDTPAETKTPEGMAKCPTCKGTGKRFRSANMRTGEATYKPCSQCGGTGLVPRETQYWSTDVGVSHQLACDLVTQHGKPAEVILEEDPSQHHAVRVRMAFTDNFQCVLGGYAAGYSGTHPDYLRKTTKSEGSWLPYAVRPCTDTSTTLKGTAGWPKHEKQIGMCERVR